MYAVEDAFRFSVSENKHAIIVNFFVDSRSTTHAVKRLNKQDGGCHPCIFITNNEVTASECKKLREAGLRPGDANWEIGICEDITKPHTEAAIVGKTLKGEPIKGDYKFTDEFYMAESLGVLAK